MSSRLKPQNMASELSISKQTSPWSRRSACIDQRATKRSTRSTASLTPTTGSKSGSDPDESRADDRLRDKEELEMNEQNLDIYGHAPIPWSRALKQLETQTREQGRTCWLATTDPDGRP